MLMPVLAEEYVVLSARECEGSERPKPEAIGRVRPHGRVGHAAKLDRPAWDIKKAFGQFPGEVLVSG
jgi:hypothetical protein